MFLVQSLEHCIASLHQKVPMFYSQYRSVFLRPFIVKVNPHKPRLNKKENDQEKKIHNRMQKGSKRFSSSFITYDRETNYISQETKQTERSLQQNETNKNGAIAATKHKQNK